jgi:hypothetical protein
LSRCRRAKWMLSSIPIGVLVRARAP